jgi:hypothetical protein
MYARVNNTSDGESARPQAQRSPRCMRPLAYWYSALIMRQSQVSLFAHSAAIHPVTNTDVMPTILNMVQAGPAPQPCDGVDISGLLRGQAGLDRDALYWHYPHYSDQGGTPSGAIREGDWKLIEFLKMGMSSFTISRLTPVNNTILPHASQIERRNWLASCASGVRA